MARDTDRKKISEAVRLQSVWKRDCYGNLNYGPGGSYVDYVTDTDEALRVEYTKAGTLRTVWYRHWDSGRPGFPLVCEERVTVGKLTYALHQIGVPREAL